MNSQSERINNLLIQHLISRCKYHHILTDGSNGFKRVESFFDQIRHKQQVKDTNSEFSIRKNKQLINSTFNFTVQVPPTNITFQWINILLIVVKKT